MRQSSSVSASELVYLLRKLFNAVLFDDERRDNFQFVRRDYRAIASKNSCHQLYGLIAKLIGLLHHGCEDRSVFHTSESCVVFIETDYLDLSDLACIFDRVQDRGPVVIP